MNEVLILTERLDYHALAVQWGLDAIGQKWKRWNRSDFPDKSSISARISVGRKPLLDTTDSDVNLKFGRYVSIWDRRGRSPTVSASLNAADKVVARAESRFLLSGIMSLLELNNPDALVINPFRNSEKASDKLYQLALAQKVGFITPKTLISNNPGQIRKFFKECEGSIIAKQHIPFVWRKADGGVAAPATCLVTEEMLASDRSLSGAPMIYQQYLNIKKEIRITAFGRTAFAITRKRKKKQTGVIRDIKWEQTKKDTCAEYKLDSDMERRCFEFMDAAGLVFATFDIAVTDTGEHVFLECNEAGQFLFLEREVPSLYLLDAFCQYLASGDPQFVYHTQNPNIRLAAFDETELVKNFKSDAIEQLRSSKTFSPFELSE